MKNQHKCTQSINTLTLNKFLLYIEYNFVYLSKCERYEHFLVTAVKDCILVIRGETSYYTKRR